MHDKPIILHEKAIRNIEKIQMYLLHQTQTYIATFSLLLPTVSKDTSLPHTDWAIPPFLNKIRT